MIAGGPLVFLGNSSNDDVLVGLSSFSIDCRDPVFTRVGAFKEWIMCVLKGSCFPPPIISLPGPKEIVNISLTTDAYPNQTELFVTNLCTNQVFSIPGFQSNLLEADTHYNFSFLLPAEGEYFLAVQDNMEDGTWEQLELDQCYNNQ